MASDPRRTYALAARAFAGLVRDIPPDGWHRPGLGEWDLRSLVGHTLRALITVATYLDCPAERVDIDNAVDYYVWAKKAGSVDPADIVERGRRAGRDLGDDPAATVSGLVDTVLARLSSEPDRLIAVIGGAGMKLWEYLPTRTFELAVHSLDIVAATGLEFSLPDEVLAETVALATRIALASGDGSTVLSALTGRTPLPLGYSIT